MLLDQKKIVLSPVFSIPIRSGFSQSLLSSLVVSIVNLWPPLCEDFRPSPAPLFQIHFWDLENRVCQALLLLNFSSEHNILILFQTDSRPTSYY